MRSPAIATRRPPIRMPMKVPMAGVRAKYGPGSVSVANANISGASSCVSAWISSREVASVMLLGATI